jgi:hypothetical protein
MEGTYFKALPFKTSLFFALHGPTSSNQKPFDQLTFFCRQSQKKIFANKCDETIAKDYQPNIALV